MDVIERVRKLYGEEEAKELERIIREETVIFWFR